MKLMLFGDSLVQQSSDFFRFWAELQGHRGVVHAMGGTAICDWFTELDAEIRHERPDRLAIAFSGNALTPCMLGTNPWENVEAYFQKYKTDAEIVMKIAGPKLPVWFVLPPANQDMTGANKVIDAYVQVADAHPNAEWMCGGELISPDLRWTKVMPRLPFEKWDGTKKLNGVEYNTVRSSDNAHFTDSGSLRYALTILKYMTR